MSLQQRRVDALGKGFRQAWMGTGPILALRSLLLFVPNLVSQLLYTTALPPHHVPVALCLPAGSLLPPYRPFSICRQVGLLETQTIQSSPLPAHHNLRSQTLQTRPPSLGSPTPGSDAHPSGRLLSTNILSYDFYCCDETA